MLLTKFAEKIKTLTLCSTTFPENLAVHEIMWRKNCTAVQATDENMAHAYCIPDN